MGHYNRRNSARATDAGTKVVSTRFDPFRPETHGRKLNEQARKTQQTGHHAYCTVTDALVRKVCTAGRTWAR
eukprot:4135136-Pyramimonas_sp.AAC.2